MGGSSSQDKIKVSVIVTVHNSERFLEDSLNSVCGQTLKDIEILCIDGGSKDASPIILESFAEKDARIRIINDSNTSYGHKINMGIQHARGGYIAILETDDMMEPDMLEILFQAVPECQPDYVDGDYYAFFCLSDHRLRYVIKKYPVGNYYGRLIKEDAGLADLMRNDIAIWTGIYRREFLLEQNIRLHESPGASFQDVSFRFLVSAMCKTSYHVETPLYNYRIDNADSSVKDMSKINVIADEYRYLQKELLAHNITDPVIWRYYYISKYSGYSWNLLRLAGKSREIFFDTYQSEVEEDIKSGRLEPENLEPSDNIYTIGALKDPEQFKEYVDKNKGHQTALIDGTKAMVEFIREKDIVVCGCGIRGKRVFQLLEPWRAQVKCFCDNDTKKQGEIIQNCRVLQTDMVKKLYPEAVYIITSKYHTREIEEQLVSLGIKKEQIFIF